MTAAGPRARVRRLAVDSVCAAAVDLARAAAEEVAGDPALVGVHLDVAPIAERVVVHTFACLDTAYRGWQWSVEIARAPRARVATVDDVVLLPGAEALLPPPWVPWSDRVRPGDLGVGDLLPTAVDDPRLVLRAAGIENELAESDPDVFLELGLGRPRLLSREGRLEAAERWWDGEPGPTSPIAKAAPAPCRTCGFFVHLAGALGRVFGVCANEYAPDDGRVVAAAHGCGAHSEALPLPPNEPERLTLRVASDAAHDRVGADASAE